MESHIKSWRVFEPLEPAFVQDIRMALVVGSEGDVGIIAMRNDQVFCIGSGPLLPAVKISSSAATGETMTTSGGAGKPRKIVELCGKKIQGICSGAKFVLVLADNGELYTWGSNDYGQLGLGQDYSNCADVPTRLNLPRSNSPVIEIACGGSHTLALTASGRVYSWGYNEYGQVCPKKLAAASEPEKIIWTPTDPLDEAGLGRSRIVSVACGAVSSFALRRDGRVWIWGKNYAAGLPHIVAATPSFLHVTAAKIVCGEQSVLVLDNKGSIYFWGDDGINIKQEPEEITGVTGTVTDIAANWSSSLHVCQVESGDIYFWGHWLGQHWKNPTLGNFPCIDAVYAMDPSSLMMCRPLVIPARAEATTVFGFSENELDSYYEFLKNRDDPQLLSNILLKLMATACRFNKQELRDECRRRLMSGVVAENALQIFQVANQLGLSDLEMMSLRAMAPPNFDKIAQADIPDGLLVLIAQKLAKLGCFAPGTQQKNPSGGSSEAL